MQHRLDRVHLVVMLIALMLWSVRAANIQVHTKNKAMQKGKTLHTEEWSVYIRSANSKCDSEFMHLFKLPPPARSWFDLVRPIEDVLLTHDMAFFQEPNAARHEGAHHQLLEKEKGYGYSHVRKLPEAETASLLLACEFDRAGTTGLINSVVDFLTSNYDSVKMGFIVKLRDGDLQISLFYPTNCDIQPLEAFISENRRLRKVLSVGERDFPLFKILDRPVISGNLSSGWSKMMNQENFWVGSTQFKKDGNWTHLLQIVPESLGLFQVLTLVHPIFIHRASYNLSRACETRTEMVAKQVDRNSLLILIAYNLFNIPSEIEAIHIERADQTGRHYTEETFNFILFINSTVKGSSLWKIHYTVQERIVNAKIRLKNLIDSANQSDSTNQLMFRFHTKSSLPSKEKTFNREERKVMFDQFLTNTDSQISILTSPSRNEALMSYNLLLPLKILRSDHIEEHVSFLERMSEVREKIVQIQLSHVINPFGSFAWNSKASIKWNSFVYFSWNIVNPASQAASILVYNSFRLLALSHGFEWNMVDFMAIANNAKLFWASDGNQENILSSDAVAQILPVPIFQGQEVKLWTRKLLPLKAISDWVICIQNENGVFKPIISLDSILGEKDILFPTLDKLHTRKLDAFLLYSRERICNNETVIVISPEANSQISVSIPTKGGGVGRAALIYILKCLMDPTSNYITAVLLEKNLNSWSVDFIVGDLTSFLQRFMNQFLCKFLQEFKFSLKYMQKIIVNQYRLLPPTKFYSKGATFIKKSDQLVTILNNNCLDFGTPKEYFDAVLPLINLEHAEIVWSLLPIDDITQATFVKQAIRQDSKGTLEFLLATHIKAMQFFLGDINTYNIMPFAAVSFSKNQLSIYTKHEHINSSQERQGEYRTCLVSLVKEATLLRDYTTKTPFNPSKGDVFNKTLGDKRFKISSDKADAISSRGQTIHICDNFSAKKSIFNSTDMLNLTALDRSNESISFYFEGKDFDFSKNALTIAIDIKNAGVTECFLSKLSNMLIQASKGKHHVFDLNGFMEVRRVNENICLTFAFKDPSIGLAKCIPLAHFILRLAETCSLLGKAVLLRHALGREPEVGYIIDNFIKPLSPLVELESDFSISKGMLEKLPTGDEKKQTDAQLKTLYDLLASFEAIRFITPKENQSDACNDCSNMSIGVVKAKTKNRAKNIINSKTSAEIPQKLVEDGLSNTVFDIHDKLDYLIDDGNRMADSALTWKITILTWNSNWGLFVYSAAELKHKTIVELQFRGQKDVREWSVLTKLVNRPLENLLPVFVRADSTWLLDKGESKNQYAIWNRDAKKWFQPRNDWKKAWLDSIRLVLHLGQGSNDAKESGCNLGAAIVAVERIGTESNWSINIVIDKERLAYAKPDMVSLEALFFRMIDAV